MPVDKNMSAVHPNSNNEPRSMARLGPWRRMRDQLLLALVTGLIGIVGGVLGAVVGGWITYKIEEKKQADEFIGKPSQYLHEKRIAMCEDMMIAVDKTSAQVREVWDITDVPDDPVAANHRAKALLATNDMSPELERLLSICKIYGDESLVKSFSGYVRLYYNVLSASSPHSAATCGMSHSETMANEIRRQLGIDALSQHLVQYLRNAPANMSEKNSIEEELERE